MNRQEIRLNEFCDIGNLEKYREVLKIIFTNIDDRGCKISTRDDGGQSIHEFISKEGKCHIRIPLKSFTKNPVEAIWVILHEFGHHQSGSIEKIHFTPEVSLKREEEAWNFARQELLKFPILAKDILDFNAYASKCLERYYKEFSNL